MTVLNPVAIRQKERDRRYGGQFVLKWVTGGRHWTRTSDLLHVKRLRLSAVLGVWDGRAK
jgi:hypothetical protein